MNNWNGIGRLTADPETRYTKSDQAVVNFTVAIDRRVKEAKETDFIRIVVWGRTGENCARYLKKGMQVGISGRIQTGSYEKDGRKIYTTDVVADRVHFIEWPDREQQGQPGGYHGQPYQENGGYQGGQQGYQQGGQQGYGQGGYQDYSSKQGGYQESFPGFGGGHDREGWS